MKGGARDGVVTAGRLASLGNMGGASTAVEGATDSGTDVANADIGRDGAPNSDGVTPAALGTLGSGASVGFDGSTAGTARNEGGVIIVTGLAKTEEVAKKSGVPEGFGGALAAGTAVAGRVGTSEATFIVSGVGGTRDILGTAGGGAGVKGTGIGATFAVSVGGGVGTGAGLVRENGSEEIGGSFACVRSCVIAVYEV